MTFFRQHEFSLKYLPLITSLYQNHYQNDNQIVHRCNLQTLLPIHDLCTFKKWHLLMTFISQNHSRHHPKHFTIYKFTINWRLQSKWQSMWQSKWHSLSLHLQMNNEYLNILHSIIFYKTSLSDTFWPFWVSLCDIYQHCNMVMGHFCVPALCLMHLWTNLPLFRSFSYHFLSSVTVWHTWKFKESVLVH